MRTDKNAGRQVTHAAHVYEKGEGNRNRQSPFPPFILLSLIDSGLREREGIKIQRKLLSLSFSLSVFAIQAIFYVISNFIL